MKRQKTPLVINALDIPSTQQKSLYPEPFASMMEGRTKHRLGDAFGLTNFGVNMTSLKPGAMSALRHSHSKQDELIYIVKGKPAMYTNEGRTILGPGMCAGFKAGEGDACHLINESDEEVLYLEIGDRTAGDEVDYPDDDIQAKMIEGKYLFFHKDGTPY